MYFVNDAAELQRVCSYDGLLRDACAGGRAGGAAANHERRRGCEGLRRRAGHSNVQNADGGRGPRSVTAKITGRNLVLRRDEGEKSQPDIGTGCLAPAAV